MEIEFTLYRFTLISKYRIIQGTESESESEDHEESEVNPFEERQEMKSNKLLEELLQVQVKSNHRSRDKNHRNHDNKQSSPDIKTESNSWKSVSIYSSLF